MEQSNFKLSTFPSYVASYSDPNQEVYHHLTRGVPDHHLPESPGVDPGPCLPHTSEPPNPGLVLGPVRPHAGNGRRRGAPLQITECEWF